MRPVLCSDVTMAARALMAAHKHGRHQLVHQILTEADFADRYRKRIGRLHPLWGDGTVAAAAQSHPMAPIRPWNDLAFLDCIVIVTNGLRAKKTEH